MNQLEGSRYANVINMILKKYEKTWQDVLRKHTVYKKPQLVNMEIFESNIDWYYNPLDINQED